MKNLLKKNEEFYLLLFFFFIQVYHVRIKKNHKPLNIIYQNNLHSFSNKNSLNSNYSAYILSGKYDNKIRNREKMWNKKNIDLKYHLSRDWNEKANSS